MTNTNEPSEGSSATGGSGAWPGETQPRPQPSETTPPAPAPPRATAAPGGTGTQGEAMPPPPGVPLPAGRRNHAVAVPLREPGPFRRGFGVGAGAGLGLVGSLLVLGTVLSLLGALAFAVLGAASSTATGAGVPNVITVWGEPSASRTLRAVDVSGTILTDGSGGGLLSGGTYGYEVAQGLDRLEAADADGIVLRINTPGGTITGSRAIADAIDRYRERTGKQVFAHVQGLSASGGMYAMAGADDIRADHGSLIGSIGVIFGPFSRYENVTSVDNGVLQGGVTASSIEQFYLTKGEGKDAGSPYRDLTEEERAVFDTNGQNEYDAFVNHIAVKREIPAQVIRDDIGAHLYNSRTAEQNGLIDGTMGVDEAYRHFATLAGLDPADTRVVAATVPTFLDTLMGAEHRVPGQALPVEAQQGVRPVTAASVCGPAPAVLVYHGDPSQVCR